MKEIKEEEKRPVFIDLRTDFGFKRCFGDERVMRRFLNILLEKDYGHIESLTFENVEQTPLRPKRRGVTFDLRCTLDSGDEVIVEMQNYGHRFFQTRANYYLYNLMAKHLEKGVVWSERENDIPHLIGIFILGVPMEGMNEMINQTAECNLKTLKIAWDRMRKYYISLPNVDRNKVELSDEDIWIQIIKDLGNMVKIDPKILERADDELKALIEKARVSALSEAEYNRYEAELKILSDEGTAERYGYDRGMMDGIKKGLTEGIEKGKAEGLSEGIEKGKAEGKAEGLTEGMAKGKAEGKLQESYRYVKEMKEKGVPLEIIKEISHLTEEEIERL